MTIRFCTFTTLVLVHFQATLFFEITHECYDWLKKLKKEKPRAILSEGTGRKTGNNLLSHSSVAALPSATEGLTSVFGMETCVSPRLWSPEWFQKSWYPEKQECCHNFNNENKSLTFGEQASLRKIRRLWWTKWFGTLVSVSSTHYCAYTSDLSTW